MNSAITEASSRDVAWICVSVCVHAVLNCALSPLLGLGSRFHIRSDIRKQSAEAINDPRVNLIEPDVRLS